MSRTIIVGKYAFFVPELWPFDCVCILIFVI